MSDIAERLRTEIERTVDLDLLHHDAAKELDRLRAEVVSLTEQLAAANERVERILKYAENALLCFDAAHTEGLTNALAEQNGERLADLIHRRIAFAEQELRNIFAISAISDHSEDTKCNT